MYDCFQGVKIQLWESRYDDKASWLRGMSPSQLLKVVLNLDKINELIGFDMF